MIARICLLLLFFACPLVAHASDARIIIACAKHDLVLKESTNTLENTCVRPLVYMDVGLSFQGLAVKMNRPREYLIGYDAGAGYGLRWLPEFWTFTGSFLSVDLYAKAGLVAKVGLPDAFTLGGLLVVSLFNWIGGGVGIQHTFGLGDTPDSTDWIGTFGLSTSL